MGGAILESSKKASFATIVLMPDTAAQLVRQRSVSLRITRQLLK